MPLKFQREGIKYDDLSEEEKDQWDALEWDEDGNVPDRVEAEAVNKWLFNKDTVDKVLEHLMTRGHDGRGRRPAGQDDHLRQEPGARRVHRGAVRRQLPALQGRVRARHHLQDRVRAEPDRRLLDHGQGAAHRHLGRHARHRHRRPGGREPRVLQAGALEDQVLADGRPRHAAVPGPVRARARTRSSSTSSTTARTSSSSARTCRRPRARSASRSASGCSRRGWS